MAFKIKDGVRIGTVDVFNNSGETLNLKVKDTGGGTGGVTLNTQSLTTTSYTQTLQAKDGTIALTSDISNAVKATSTTLGTVELFSDTVQSVAANAVTTTANRTYGVQLNSNDQMVVNVPWVDTTVEADTLQTVTGRGATSNVATITLSASTASSNTTTGTLVVTGGVGIGGNLNVGGNTIISGNLTVNGTTTTVNSTTTTLDDPIITLGGDTAPASDDNKDRGVEYRWHNGTVAKLGFFGYDDSTGKFTFIPDATNTSEVFSGTKGELDANVDWSNILNKPTLPVKATSTVLGIVKLEDDTVQSTAANAVTTTAARTYGVQLNSSDQMVVNVPWVDTNTTYSKATSTSLGLVELFSDTVQATAANAVTTTASRTYGVQLNSLDQMVVNVPWVDTPESDTLATVTGRGNTTTTDVQLNNSSLVLAPTGTTAKVWKRAVTTTLAANTATAIDSWATGTYRSAKYYVQATQGSKYYSAEINVIHDGTAALITEFAVLENTAMLWGATSWTPSISGGILTLSALITDAATTNVVFQIERTLFAV